MQPSITGLSGLVLKLCNAERLRRGYCSALLAAATITNVWVVLRRCGVIAAREMAPAEEALRLPISAVQAHPTTAARTLNARVVTADVEYSCHALS